VLLTTALASGAWAQKSEPANVYLFPAGAQRGTQVQAALEGENVTTLCDFHLAKGRGISAPPQARDRKVTLSLEKDAPVGLVTWRIATAQGGAGSRAFAVGEYPEVVETEPGVVESSAEPVRLPVTVNGRLNPDGDVDRFSFQLRAGQAISAEVLAARLGGPIDTNCFTGQFGNPPDDLTYKQLDASLELYDPEGRLVAQAEDTFGLDPALGFVAKQAGRYTVAVRHLALAGLPQFVYRLTLAEGPLVASAYPAGGQRGTTVNSSLQGPGVPSEARAEAAAGAVTRLASGSTAYPLQVSDHPESLETEPNDAPAGANAISLPAVLNGRFQQPGDVDTYRVRLAAGSQWRFRAWVRSLGSPTDVTVSLADASGKVLASAAPAAVGTDPTLWYAVPQDGEYLLQVREAAMSRLGERLVYRLEAVPQASDFRLELAAEGLDTQPGAGGEIEVRVSRLGGFAGLVRVTVEGLPPGMSAAPLELPVGQEKAKLKLTAAPDCRAGSWPVRVVGHATVDGADLARSATAPVGNPAELTLNSAPREVEELLLTVRYPTQFTIVADDSYLFLNLGSIHPAKINIQRQPGFTAPLHFSMADRQPRNPFGIEFRPVTVTGSEAAAYVPMVLPQGPRGNEIARCYVKAEAVVKDADGREWHLLQTSSKNVVSRTIAPLLSLVVEPDAMRVEPGAAVPLRFHLGRTAESMDAAEVRLLPALGVRGITFDPATVAPGATEAEGMLRVDANAAMGQETELWFEVTSKRSTGQTLFYRARLEFDLRRKPSSPPQ
jgi:hypothetical protein